MIYTLAEKAAFAPQEELTPSQWADRYAYISDNKKAPGKYSGDVTPYWRGVADCLTEEHVRKIVVIKSTRVGYTQMLSNLIGWAADQLAAPQMLLMPTDKAGAKLVNEDIKPALRASPKTAPMLLETNKDELRFTTSVLHLAYSNSETSMASTSERFVWIDEVEKFKVYDGKTADPVENGIARTIEWGSAGRVMIGSSPKRPDGYIATLHAACGDKRTFVVPCPHCYGYQSLIFDQLKWDNEGLKKQFPDRRQRADHIAVHKRAHYECQKCKGKITDAHKPAMLLKGVWLSEGQTITPDGVVHGERPKAREVGFRINSLNSIFVEFSELVQQFLKCKGNHAKMFAFKTNWLGEIYQYTAKKITVDESEATKAPPAGIAPRWTKALTTTADRQKTGFYFITRAWCGDMSQIVKIGFVQTFDELRTVGLNTQFPVEGTIDTKIMPQLLLLDSGGNTENGANEVYRFAASDPRIRPLKGEQDLSGVKTFWWSKAADQFGTSLLMVNTHYYKTALLMMQTAGQMKVCQMDQMVAAQYYEHLRSAEMHMDEDKGRMVWGNTTEGAADHYHDCEVYQVAASEVVGVINLPSIEQQKAQWKADEEAKTKAKTQLVQLVEQPQFITAHVNQNDSWF